MDADNTTFTNCVVVGIGPLSLSNMADVVLSVVQPGYLLPVFGHKGCTLGMLSMTGDCVETVELVAFTKDGHC